MWRDTDAKTHSKSFEKIEAATTLTVGCKGGQVAFKEYILSMMIKVSNCVGNPELHTYSRVGIPDLLQQSLDSFFACSSMDSKQATDDLFEELTGDTLTNEKSIFFPEVLDPVREWWNLVFLSLKDEEGSSEEKMIH